jgi:hypothetical protein
MTSQPPKSKEELEREQKEAAEKLAQMMQTSKPKNLQQGLGRGVGNILAGAVGGVGIAVLAPTMGLAAGVRGGGILGGIIGVTAGAVVGYVLVFVLFCFVLIPIISIRVKSVVCKMLTVFFESLLLFYFLIFILL